MIYVHLTDGKTLRFEYATQEALQALNRPDITSVTLQHNGVQQTISRPRGFERVAFGYQVISAAKGAQRIECYADDALLTLTIHNETPAARVALRAVGLRVYNPEGDV